MQAEQQLSGQMGSGEHEKEHSGLSGAVVGEE